MTCAQILTKPHGQQLWALDRDKVGLALVGNSLGQQRLPTACRGEQVGQRKPAASVQSRSAALTSGLATTGVANISC